MTFVDRYCLFTELSTQYLHTQHQSHREYQLTQVNMHLWQYRHAPQRHTTPLTLILQVPPHPLCSVQIKPAATAAAAMTHTNCQHAGRPVSTVQAVHALSV